MASTYSPKQFIEPKNTTKACKNCPDVIFRQNGSSHIKATFPKGGRLPNGKILKQEEHLEYPAHETGIGLAVKIFKFLKGIGLIGFLFIVYKLVNFIGENQNLVLSQIK